MAARRRVPGALIGGAFLLLLAFSRPAGAVLPAGEASAAQGSVRVLVGFETGTDSGSRDAALTSAGLAGGQTLSPLAGDVRVVPLPAGVSASAAVARLNANPAVRYAEVDGSVVPFDLPNDTYFLDGSEWGMGSAGFGANAVGAWSQGFTGSATVAVGVIDTGVMTTHPDLQPNRWVNSVELAGARNKDDDLNGYKDDIYGWDFQGNDATVFDGGEDRHGTFVAGILGAAAYTGTATPGTGGVVGVNWNVKIIPAKFLTTGYISNAVRAIDYMVALKTKGVANVVAINASWGTQVFSQTLLDALNRAGDAGILVVAASGNASADIDLAPEYPASNVCTTASRAWDCVISVTGIDVAGAIASDLDPNGASYSMNYGHTGVDLAAPAKGIFSTFPVCSTATSCTPGWVLSPGAGTSFSAPFVTGAAALCASINPSITAGAIRAAILSSVAPTASLDGKTVTGGRLDIGAMVAKCQAPPIAVRLEVVLTNVDAEALEVGGTVTLPTGLTSNCETTSWFCRDLVPGTPEVTLSASPAAGHRFVGWSGACSGAGTCVVDTSADRTATATFEAIPRWTLHYDEAGYDPTDPDRVSHGTVALSPTGSSSILVSGDASCSGDCDEQVYDSATSITLTAQPANGYRFVGWSGDTCDQSTSPACVIASPLRLETPLSELSVTATFEAIPTWTLHYTKAGTGSGTVAFTPSTLLAVTGSCSDTCDKTVYDSATSLTLTATAASAGSVFTGWSGGACDGTTATTCVIASPLRLETPLSELSVTATFEAIPTWTLHYTKAGTGSGTVAFTPSTLLVVTGSCSGDCDKTVYDSATSLTLTATAPAGSVFTGWTGGACDGTTATTCGIASPLRLETPLSELSVTATFEAIPTWTLHYTKAGTGSGTVAFTPSTLLAVTGSCSDTCDKTVYDSATSLTLTATAASAGSVFTGWSGDVCDGSTAATCVIASPLRLGTPLSELSVTATFAPGIVLTYIESGQGTVSFSASPAWPATSCTASCTRTFPAGTNVTVTATPDAGYTFSSWSGDCTAGSCSLALSSAKSITANFASTVLRTLTVKKTLARNITATVVSSPSGISCGATCSFSYANGTVVTLSISSTNGTKFAWSGCGSVSGTGASSTCLVTMSASKSVTLKVS